MGLVPEKQAYPLGSFLITGRMAKKLKANGLRSVFAHDATPFRDVFISVRVAPISRL